MSHQAARIATEPKKSFICNEIRLWCEPNEPKEPTEPKHDSPKPARIPFLPNEPIFQPQSKQNETTYTQPIRTDCPANPFKPAAAQIMPFA
jgi:hypothetical protein